MKLLNIINKTIKYTNRFGARLNLNQLYFRLLSNKKYTLNEIEKIIKN